MGYAAEGDVRRELGAYSNGWPPPGGRPPTVADGVALADDASGMIDAVLNSKGIITPVGAPASFLSHLANMAGRYAAAHIIRQLFPQSAGPGSTTDQDRLMNIWRDELEDLRKGDMIPSNLPLGAAGALGRSYWTSNPTDDDGNDTTEPIFKVKSEQW